MARSQNLIKLAFVTLIFISSPASRAEGGDFLAKSKLIQSAKLRILPAEIHDLNILLPSSDIEEPAFAIGVDGLFSLKTLINSTKMALRSNACAGEIKVQPWTPLVKRKIEAPLVVVGNIPTDFKMIWSNAKRLSSKRLPSCLKKSKKSGFENAVGVEIPGAQLKSYTVFRRAIQKKSKSMEFDPDEKLGVDEVGLIDSNKCHLLLSSPVDIEGQGYSRGRFGEPIGLLKISKGLASESWLVFKATGYEGDAILGIRLRTDKIVEPSTDVDFYIYSGC